VDDPISILERLVDWTAWPTYRSTEQSRLGVLAKKAFQRKTFDGYLSYVLITSQLCEDLARILLKQARFTLQICVAVKGFGWQFPKKELGRDIDELMFGHLLQAIENAVDFPAKKEFIAACRKLSQARNLLAHELDQGVSLTKIKELAAQCSKLAAELTDHFNDADDHFSDFFVKASHDPGWDQLLTKRVQNATLQERRRLEKVRAKLAEQRDRSEYMRP
jgi:hypothetical protein